MNRTRRWRRAALFFTIFLAYAGMQTYAVATAYTGLQLSPGIRPALGAWVVLMTFFPLLLWRLERGGWHRLATAGAWVGYSWMGVVFVFFWMALGLDLLGVVVATTVPGALGLAGDGSAGLDSFPLASAISIGVAAYGFFAAGRPRVERVTLASSKLPAGRAPLRIALISDVHLGALVGARRLRRILARVSALDPDIVVSAGDLVDGQADRVNQLAPMLAALRPRLGKFAVTGNHEFYVGLKHALDFHERAGFTVLRGAAMDVTDELSIVGVDDPAAVGFGVAANTGERTALATVAPGRFVILLKHQPVVAADAARLFDLQLSGHVHKGQIFPFGLIVRLVYPMPTGLTELPAGGRLYVSRGTGTWGPPMRVLAPPEITLIEIAASA